MINETNGKKLIKNALSWRLRKYYRYMKLYLRRVRSTEEAIGGELHAC